MNCKENIIKAAVQIISNNGLNFSMDELASKLKMSKRNTTWKEEKEINQTWRYV